jgi:hypothetical protein
MFDMHCTAAFMKHVLPQLLSPHTPGCCVELGLAAFAFFVRLSPLENFRLRDCFVAGPTSLFVALRLFDCSADFAAENACSTDSCIRRDSCLARFEGVAVSSSASHFEFTTAKHQVLPKELGAKSCGS